MKYPDNATATGKVSLTGNKDRLTVKFPFLPATINKVKTLSGRRWHAGDRMWTADLTVTNLEHLKEWGFELSTDTRKILIERTMPAPIIDLSATVFRGEPYPFQREGVERIISLRGRALLGDEMGIGKTIQALMWLYLTPEARPAIVVCPASLKLNWEREARAWLDPSEHIIVINGTNSDRIDADVIIINYDILALRLEDMPPRIQAVILDESHAIKSRKAQRTKAAQSLCKNVPYMLALTGTPILNRPVEIFNSVNLVAPGVFPHFFYFAKRYCNATHGRFGWDFNGASNIPELYELLIRTCMIRRLKADVLKDLPAKQRSHVPIELENAATYKAAEEDFIGWLRSEGETERANRASQAVTLTRIEGLKQIAAEGSLKSAIAWITDFLDTGKKLVAFAVHKKVLDALQAAFPDCVRVDGSTPQAARQEAVDRFQGDDKVRLFIGNVQAAGVGITLTAADSVAFLELPWTPGHLTQAEDRVHRIGQESDSVNIYYLVAAGTIMEEVATMLDRKARVLAQVLDGAGEDEGSLLMDIISKYGGPVT